ncbi:MAG: cell division protein [Proteobacteria bacterium]|nr:cell division protein [Pseudomonadota bacterium]
MSPGPYFERHAQTFVGALGRLARRPLASALIMGVIGIALALPLLLQLLVQNARALTSNGADAFELAVYLKPATEEAAARTLASQLRGRSDLAAVRLVTATQGLAEFREHSGFGAALDLLAANPLPHVLLLTPAENSRGSEALQRLQSQLKELPAVDDVQLDTAWVKRLQAMLDLLRQLVLSIGALLLAGVAVIVGSTIRFEVTSRRHEIEVMKLLGGSNAFARRPFLYSGLLYGLGGGLVCLTLVAVARYRLDPAVRALTATYGQDAGLIGLGFELSLAALAAAMALGWLGAWVAASWQIRHIDPT